MNDLPKVFCLTLKETPLRRQYAEQHFESHKLNVEFFEGIHGENFGLKTTIPYKDDNPFGEDYFITSGHIGCIISHLMLWKTLQYLPYDEILILEDDIILCDNFKEKFIKYKSELPEDWQYVFVGNCCLPPEEYQIKITENIISTYIPPMCTHAYMIKKSSLPILIETNSLAWSHVDIQIQKRSLKKLKHYVFNPVLATQKSLSEDGTGIFRSLTFDFK